MKRILVCLILVYVIIGLSAEIVEINPFQNETFTVNLIDCSDHSTTVEFILNRFSKSYMEIDGERYVNINVPSSAYHHILRVLCSFVSFV